jgi:DNA-binding NtrC family response regulator
MGRGVEVMVTGSPLHVLVVDDEDLIRWSLKTHFEGRGHRVRVAADGAEALRAIAVERPDVLLLDLTMPNVDGREVLRTLQAAGRLVPTIVLTAHADLASAVELTQLGATAYLSKPFDLARVEETVLRVGAAARRQRDEVMDALTERPGFDGFLGRAPSLSPVFHTLERLATVDVPTVLILGESGTGKDVVARLVHQRGVRRHGPFLDVDCASLPATLIESELFGHEKGAFTDARAQKPGLFEAAAGGVVFLDEIGELPLPMQAKLLRALETRTFRRVGGVVSLPMDVALVAATNRDLAAEVRAGRFREDLFFRLDIVPIRLPPLADRRSDIPGLASAFLQRFSASHGRRRRAFSGEAMDRLVAWSWPGNIRELRNVVERLVLLGEGEVVSVEELPPEIRWAKGTEAERRPLPPWHLPPAGLSIEDLERRLIAEATARDPQGAAALLGLSPHALAVRAAALGVTREARPEEPTPGR